ncbi:hypothetical protein JZ751_018916 [Albula glossodonta]|nr:hypothetical protein JZ751_018916 [Albula glossodonta]
MGITDPFEHTADLTGISADGKLFVSKVIHKANLDVTEEGTVASAATAVKIMLRSGIEFVPPILTFDHPFLVFVIDSETMSVLLMGKIVNP